MEVPAAQVVLVGLAAAKEVEALAAVFDGVSKAGGLGEQADGEIGVLGVVAAVVDEGLGRVFEAED